MKKQCKLVVGVYCEVHDESETFNTMTPRTHGAISVGPIGDLNGTYKFFFLETGRILKWHKCTDYPISQQVINKVNKWRGGVKENRIWGKFVF